MAGSLSPRILSTLSDCPFLPIVIYTVSGTAKSLGDKPDTDTERLPRSLRQALRCQRISFEVTSALGNWNDQLFASQPSIDIYGSLSFELRTQVFLPLMQRNLSLFFFILPVNFPSSRAGLLWHWSSSPPPCPLSRVE